MIPAYMICSTIARTIARTVLDAIPKSPTPILSMKNTEIGRDKMKTFPCKDCTVRHSGCHDHCKGYKAFKKEYDEMMKELKKAQEDIYASTKYRY